MFFNVSDCLDDSFPVQHRVGPFYIGLDNGWNIANIGEKRIFYKGYLDQGRLDEKIADIVCSTEPLLTGNFCVLVCTRDCVEIKHDIERSFPLYHVNKSVTNLYIGNKIYANTIVSINSDLTLRLNKFKTIKNLNTSTLTKNEVINEIDNLLSIKVKSFLENNDKPIKIFLSGGLDTLLIYSYISKYTNNFQLCPAEHLYLDDFYISNKNIFTKHWAYNQIHHYKEPCILVSGAMGDETMMRSPVYGDIYLKAHRTSMKELLLNKEYKNSYHTDYFLRPKNLEKYDIIKIKDFKNLTFLIMYISDQVLNDHQHWHLGNTLTYTPLKDLRILHLLLRLSFNDLIGQIIDGQISKELIIRNDPSLISKLNYCKNPLRLATPALAT